MRNCVALLGVQIYILYLLSNIDVLSGADEGILFTSGPRGHQKKRIRGADNFRSHCASHFCMCLHFRIDMYLVHAGQMCVMRRC